LQVKIRRHSNAVLTNVSYKTDRRTNSAILFAGPTCKTVDCFLQGLSSLWLCHVRHNCCLKSTQTYSIAIERTRKILVTSLNNQTLLCSYITRFFSFKHHNMSLTYSINLQKHSLYKCSRSDLILCFLAGFMLSKLKTSIESPFFQSNYFSLKNKLHHVCV